MIKLLSNREMELFRLAVNLAIRLDDCRNGPTRQPLPKKYQKIFLLKLMKMIFMRCAKLPKDNEITPKKSNNE
jgi:hypothetical protein